MSDRSYAVVVLPDDWGGSLEELAGQMMPVTRRGPKQVLPLLERGPMTLEADLSVEEAGLLQARLNNLGVPAQVIDGDGEVVANSAHGGSEPGLPDPEPTQTALTKQAPSASGIRLPKPKSESKPTSKPKPEPSDSGEWADVFPDLEGAKAATGAGPKSLDELAGDADDGFGAEPAPKAPAEPGAPEEAKEPEETQKPETPAEPRRPTPQPPIQPRSTGPSRTRERRIEPRAPASFDAGKMSDALKSANGEKPPYAPSGFDDSMAHIPAIAAVLSVLAPGAGQVYNGQEEQAREFGVRFALVVPWYESVRQAYAYAEEIRTYWAPLPEPGALGAALKYMGIWWIIVGTVVAGLGWSGSKLYDVVKTPEAPKITRADVRLAVGDARLHIQMARISGLDGVSAYLDERSRNHKRFTMTKEERAERLFRRGIVYCKEGNYSTCESAMKRVSALSSKLRRDAYRLQAWASVQGATAGEGEPMPETENGGTLQQFEQDQQFEQNQQFEPDQQFEQNQQDAGAPEERTDPGQASPDNPP